MRRSFAFGLGSVLVASLGWGLLLSTPGCLQDPTASNDSAPQEILEQGRRLASVDGAWLAMLNPSDHRFALDAGAFVSGGWKQPGKLGAALPAKGDDAWRLGVGPAVLKLTPEQAKPSSGSLQQGKLVYPGMHPFTDVVVASDDRQFEWFYLLRNEQAPEEFSFKVDLPAGITDVTEDQGGLLLRDAEGHARLQMPRPEAVDAEGKKHLAQVSWNNSRLTVKLAHRGLSHPVLLDPSLGFVGEWKFAQGYPNLEPAVMGALDGKIVLWGKARSSQSNIFRHETWEWNGSTWLLRTTSGPSVTSNGSASKRSMAALPGRLVLYGGATPSGQPDTSTWEWDGNVWTEKKLTPNPGDRRRGAPMASHNGKVYLIHGTFSPNSEMWVYDGNNWTVAPGSVPLRFGNFAFGSAAGKLVMAGGNFDGNPAQTKETWTWGGNSWVLEASQTPISVHFHGVTLSNGSLYACSFGGGYLWNGSVWSFKNATEQDFCSSNAGTFSMAQGSSQVIGFQGSSSHNSGKTFSLDASQKETLAQEKTFANVEDVYDSLGQGSAIYFTVRERDTNSTSMIAWNSKTRSWSRLFEGLSGAFNLIASGSDTMAVDRSTYVNGSKVSDYGPFNPDSPSSGASYKGKFYAVNDSYNAVKVFSGTTWQATTDIKPPPSGTNLARIAGPSPAQDRLFAFRDGACFEWLAPTWQEILDCNSSPGFLLLSDRGIYLIGGNRNSPDPSKIRRWDGVAWRPLTISGKDLTGRKSPLLGALDEQLMLLGGEYERDLNILDVVEANGSTCSAGADCASGFCVDGVCCDAACTGLCEACSAAKKGQGSDGTCGPISNNFDPDNECEILGTNDTCKTKGFCNGAKKCESKVGLTCKSSVCESFSAQIKASLCNDVGECIDQGSKQCFPFLCAGGACLTACAKDQDCQGGYFCQNSACVASANQGNPCSKNSECGSSFCVDGVCCDSACTGSCRACSTDKKGYGNDGTCQDVLAGSDPDDDCAMQAAATCGSNGVCDGKGACAQHAQGTSCGATSCAGGEVTGKVCDGQGKCLSSTEPVSCFPYTGCADASVCASGCGSDVDCATNHFCDLAGTPVVCRPDLPDGVSCEKNSQCASGQCADGVCCNAACDGPCEACKVGENDPKAGVCRAVEGSPLAGHPACPGSGECKGVCDGVVRDACMFPGEDKGCGGGACAAGQVTGNRCSGSGSCVAGSPVSCFPYLGCADGSSCATTCASDNQCDPGHYCDTASKKCVADRTDGETCKKAGECASGNCVDGVCCDSPCDGGCQFCAVEGSQGICTTLLSGKPLKPGVDCGSDPLCGGECKGKPNDCTYPAQGTECAPATCASADVSGSARVCDGAGKCEASKNGSCAPFLCDDATGTCKTKCSNDKDCSTGAVCSTNGQCTLGEASCADNATAKAPDGSLTSCEPFTCLNGQCRSSCASDLDCTSLFRCEAQTCVSRNSGAGNGGTGGSAGSGGSAGNGGAGAGGAGAGAGGAATAGGEVEEEGGCGCRVAGNARSEGGAAGLLLGLALAARRRRRVLG